MGISEDKASLGFQAPPNANGHITLKAELEEEACLFQEETFVNLDTEDACMQIRQQIQLGTVTNLSCCLRVGMGGVGSNHPGTSAVLWPHAQVP